MAPMGPTAFAVLVWGGILGVALVFLYEVWVLAREVGWVG
jgi:hypothetical protein